MSPAGNGLRSIVDGARRVLRRDAMLAVAGVALAAVPVALMAAFVLGRAPAWLAPSPLPLLLELCALALAAAAAWFAFRRWVRGLDEPHVAAAAEQTLGMAQGSLRGVLELGRHVPEGTSPALFRRAEDAVALQMRGHAPRQLTGAAGLVVRRRMMNAFAVLVALSTVAVALGFASPKHSKASWTPLLHPVAHLSPPPLPTLVVEPGNVEVQRGGAIDVRVQAPGRLDVEVHWRAAGDVPRVRDLEVLDGLAATQITNIDAAVEYWVSAPDGAISETYRITPVDPLLLSELVVDIAFPAYLNRPAERYEGELPPLRIPAGSTLQFNGRSTRPLMSVALERADGTLRLPLQVTSDKFAGRWAPQSSGVYGWKILGRNGGIPAEQPTPIDLVLVPDSAPRVEITFPEPDTTLGPDMQQQVLASVRDDYGLRGATLISWRVSSLGDREPAVEQPLVLEGAEDHANIQTILDASDRRLLPGDTLHYMIRAADNSPSRQVGSSPVYTLRLPTLGELRADANNQADKLLKNSRELSQSLKQLQENTRDFQRQSSSSSTRPQSDRSNQPGGKPGEQKEKDKAGFEKTEQGKAMVERQEAMLDKAGEMREEIKKLERAMQAAGLQDPELQKRMAELKQLYDQMLTPEMKQKLSEMKKGMEQMDAEEMKRSMEQLAKQQEQLKKQIDQSLELMRRAAAEQKMNSLAQHAKELSTQEQALAEALKRQEPPKPPHDDSDGHHNQDNKPQPPKPHDDSDGHHDKDNKPQPPRPGEQKAGEQKAGEQKAGEQKAGEQKAGEQKAGEQKAGEQKAGEQKAGEQKAGEQKAGEQKAGEQKAGEQKAGEQRAGEKNDESAAKRQADIARQTDSLRQELDQLQKQLSEQGEKKAAEQTSKAGQQAKEAQQSMKQAQEQSQQKQGEQASKSAEQGSKKLDEASKTLDQARQQMANQWKQQTQQQVQQAAQEAQQLAQRQNALQQKMQQQQSQQGQGPASQDKQGNKKGQAAQANPSVGTAQSQGSDKGNQAGGTEGGEMKSEQAALQQSLEQIGKNIADASQKSAMVNKEVGQSLGRAMLSMEQTMNAMQQQGAQQRNPSQEAAQTVNALNKLALALANNSQQISQSETGTGLQEALQKMAELAKQQGAVNGQTNSLVPLDLSPASISQQMQRLAQQQREIAQKLGSMQNGVKDDQLGRVDQLAKEADEIARELSGNRLSAEMLARQERLFHKLLDAGRTLEKDDVSNQRVAERPGTPIPSNARGLDPALMDANGRFRMPTPDELKAMPPAYRRLILEYFDRLNKNPDSGNTSAGTQR